MKSLQFDRILRIANYMICLIIQINYICPVKRNKAFSRHAHEAMQISSSCFFIITKVLVKEALIYNYVIFIKDEV